MKPFLILSILACTFLIGNVSGQSQTKVVGPLIRTKSNSNLIVSLRDSLDPVYDSFESRTFSNRTASITAFRDSLREFTSARHRPIIEGLRPFGVETTSFWITNQIYVRGANPRVVSYLDGLPSVSRIEEDLPFPYPDTNPSPGSTPLATEWGVTRIGAEQVWQAGYRGQGVRVAVIDTGVRGTHEALRGNFVGLNNNGWFDPVLRSAAPADRIGHGTHCTGTVAGTNGIGVAPAARWMACRACEYDQNSQVQCFGSALISCGQWALCPTDAAGNNANCALAPHVVSNSWYGPGGNNWYNNVIRAWNQARIVSFFCIGNNGANCRTAGSPADQPGVNGIGASNRGNTVSTFSSRGPAIGDGSIVPSWVAPGERINSAYYTADNAYYVMDGCSMATPHSAGAAALLLSANPNLTPDQVRNLVIANTDRNLNPTGQQCGNGADNQYPNNLAGYGVLNVARAFQARTG